MRESTVNIVRRFIGDLASAVIMFLCFLLGRRIVAADYPWLDGPTGPKLIGPQFHREVADAAGYEVRSGDDLGLLPDMTLLDSGTFDTYKTQVGVREFYEHTARYHLDVWSQWSPLFWVFGWALMTFVSRRMQQLNIPMYPLETAHGMSSEVEQLADKSGRVTYTSWLRRNLQSGYVIYSGFYTTCTPIGHDPCVKVVFPVPGGNATVVLRPEVQPDGSFKLISRGRHFGDPGFYRVTDLGNGRRRVWYVRALTEIFHVYEDKDGSLRTDHYLKWWGMPVLHLHYHITLTPTATRSAPEALASARRS